MRWKIRCTGPATRAQSIENKRGKPQGSFRSLSAEKLASRVKSLQILSLLAFLIRKS
jgi:hypothetical protein